MPESGKRDSKMESEQGTGIGPQAPLAWPGLQAPTGLAWPPGTHWPGLAFRHPLAWPGP